MNSRIFNLDSYIDDILHPDQHLAESTESIREVALWCNVIERIFEDLKVFMKCCNKGIVKGYYDGSYTWYFHEREKLLRYIYSIDFETVCESANVPHLKIANEFEQLLQMQV